MRPKLCLEGKDPTLSGVLFGRVLVFFLIFFLKLTLEICCTIIV